MPWLLQHHHHRGHFDERQVVGRLLLVPRRHPPMLLDLRPEPLAQVPLPVQVPVDLPLLLATSAASGSPPRPRDARRRPPAPCCRTPCPRSPPPVRGRPAAPRPGRCPTPGPPSRATRRDARARRCCRGPWSRSRRGCGRGPARPGRRCRPTFFRPRGAGVGADGRRVEDQQVELGVAQRGEDRVPTPGPGPAVEPPPDGVWACRTAPGTSAQGMPVRPTNTTASMNRRLSAVDPAVLPRAAGQEVLDPVPVGVGDRVSRKHRWPSVA